MLAFGPQIVFVNTVPCARNYAHTTQASAFSLGTYRIIRVEIDELALIYLFLM
jgi:hypothetical protein